MTKKNLFKTRATVMFFAIISIFGGMMFLKKNFTALAILENQSDPTFNAISLIGLLLIFCSATLFVYALKLKR